MIKQKIACLVLMGVGSLFLTSCASTIETDITVKSLEKLDIETKAGFSKGENQLGNSKSLDSIIDTLNAKLKGQEFTVEKYETEEEIGMKYQVLNITPGEYSNIEDGSFSLIENDKGKYQVNLKVPRGKMTGINTLQINMPGKIIQAEGAVIENGGKSAVWDINKFSGDSVQVVSNKTSFNMAYVYISVPIITGGACAFYLSRRRKK